MITMLAYMITIVNYNRWYYCISNFPLCLCIYSAFKWGIRGLPL